MCPFTHAPRPSFGELLRLLAALGALWMLSSPGRVHAHPPQFGVELKAGSALGLSSYLKNEALIEQEGGDGTGDGANFTPSLADIDTGTGPALSLQLLASSISAGLSFQYLDLPAHRVHHRGERSLPPTRLRADGSVDDSGMSYSRVDPPIKTAISERTRDSLLLLGLGGDYRFFWPADNFDVYIPVGVEMVLTHITRPASPYRLGLNASSGVGTTVRLGDNIALVLDARLHALATTHYGRRADAARRAVSVDESTEAAFFSTLLYGSAHVGLQFRIR